MKTSKPKELRKIEQEFRRLEAALNRIEAKKRDLREEEYRVRTVLTHLYIRKNKLMNGREI